ncbi:MAG: triose-phosphate isomerase [Patescibacteria group bacterium]
MKPLIIGNWKCNPKTLKEAKELFNKVKKTKAVICPPFIYLSIFRGVELGAQNCFWKESGAYTGEVSAVMLRDFGVKYIIIGHSERRIHFRESDEMINKKLKAVLKTGLIPILCVGEKKGENVEKVISIQIRKDLERINKKDFKKIIIAYEPVWAIGTGDFCPKNKAKKALDFIKQKINSKVLYGGSVNSKVAEDYIRVGYDGLLVGGASLDTQEFIKIVKQI